MMTLTMDRDRQATMSGLRMTHTVSPAIFMTSLWMLKTNKVSHNLELKTALKDHTALLKDHTALLKTHTALLKAQSSTVRLKDLALMVLLKNLALMVLLKNLARMVHLKNLTHMVLLKDLARMVLLKNLARMVPLKSLRVLKDMLDQLHTYTTWVLSLDHSRAPIKIVSRLLNQVINSSLPVSVTSTTQSSATSRANLMLN